MGMTAAYFVVSGEVLDRINAGNEDVGALVHRQLALRNSSACLDIDKSWAGIHYLLTGSQWGGTPPHSVPILGGVEVGRDLGYGPARLLQPSEVAEASALLAATPLSELKRRFNPVEMDKADIYPNVWADEGDESFEYLAHWYVELQKFYASAARAGHGMLLAII